MGNIVRWLLGGRPMIRGEYLLTDVVSGEPVYHWLDTYGRVWMATGAWSLFRVRVRCQA